MNFRSIAAAAMLAVLALPAAAADLPPLKAPALVQSRFSCGSTTTCIGPYVGVDVSGLTANMTSFLPTASGGVSAGDLTLGVHGGFQYWNGHWFAAAELGARYSMAQDLSALGGADPNRFTYFETVKLGANLAGLIGNAQGALAGGPAGTVPVAPSASGPLAGFNLSADFLSKVTSAYLQVGAAQRFNKTGTVTGAGVQFLIGPQWTADADYKHITWGDNGAPAGAALALKTEDVVSVGVSYHFGSGRGFLGL